MAVHETFQEAQIELKQTLENMTQLIADNMRIQRQKDFQNNEDAHKAEQLARLFVAMQVQQDISATINLLLKEIDPATSKKQSFAREDFDTFSKNMAIHFPKGFSTLHDELISQIFTCPSSPYEAIHHLANLSCTAEKLLFATSETDSSRLVNDFNQLEKKQKAVDEVYKPAQEGERFADNLRLFYLSTFVLAVVGASILGSTFGIAALPVCIAILLTPFLLYPCVEMLGRYIADRYDDKKKSSPEAQKAKDELKNQKKDAVDMVTKQNNSFFHKVNSEMKAVNENADLAIDIKPV